MLEQALAANTAAIEALTALLSKMSPVAAVPPAANAETPKQEAAKVEAPKPQAAPVTAKAEAAPIPPTVASPAAPEPKVESSAVTFEDLKKAFLALAGKNREAAVKLLSEHGCQKLTEAKPEQFAAIHEAITKALG